MKSQLPPSPTITNTDPGTPYQIPVFSLLKKTLVFALPFIAIFGLAIFGYYYQQVSALENYAQEMNHQTNLHLLESLQQILRNVKGDARMLSSNPLLIRALSSPQEKETQLLAQQWIAFSAEKRLYDQIRLLDQKGQEILRINMTTNGAQSVPKNRLQNKSARYYFKEAMTLPKGEIYLSSLDLNIENKVIEKPLKPMLRIAVPLFDNNGKRLGLLILNYLAANFINEIKTHNRLSESQSILINQQGYYLYGLSRDREWLFMYPKNDQLPGLLSTQFRDLWQYIIRNRQDQVITSQGIFSFHWLSTEEKSSSNNPFLQEYAIITMLSMSKLEALKAPYRQAVWGISLLAIPTIVLFALVASHYRLRELKTIEQLRTAETNQRLILESVGEGIIGLDAHGRLTFANSRAQDLTGYLLNEMLGRPLHNLIGVCGNDKSRKVTDTWPLHETLVHGKSRREDNDIFYRKNCDAFPVEYISNPIIKDGELHGGVVSFLDITARKKAEQRIEYLVLNDSLTDLPNKRLFLDRLNQQLANARNNHQTTALLYIDIDRFKQINDALGYEKGDDILRETARRLKYLTQEGDTIARIGSDEFVLLCANRLIDEDHMAHIAQLTADEIMLILEQPFYLGDSSVRITASIGITIFPFADEDASTILAQADTAVASAKGAGRYTTRFFKSEMEQTTKGWLNIHNRMLDALAEDSFTLAYQPKVKQDGSLIGIEALLRWQDEKLGAISPAQFIPIAEQSGLIYQINDFVLGKACQQIKTWRDEGLINCFGRVAINISPNQFLNRDFVSQILDHVKHAGIKPTSIELEITESTLAQDTPLIHDKLVSLREQGIRISIDDFGTGYSSLAYLQQLPLDWLKIDRTFVTDADKSSDRQSIVEAIILLARSLSIEVIAEGVETRGELDYLLEAGCQEFQGFYFYKPMSPENLTDLMLSHKNHPPYHYNA
jgi:diguanylate cyclase (GGDEF)-like protein/PAS domain S-box-containing protein